MTSDTKKYFCFCPGILIVTQDTKKTLLVTQRTTNSFQFMFLALSGPAKRAEDAAGLATKERGTLSSIGVPVAWTSGNVSGGSDDALSCRAAAEEEEPEVLAESVFDIRPSPAPDGRDSCSDG